MMRSTLAGWTFALLAPLAHAETLTFTCQDNLFKDPRPGVSAEQTIVVETASPPTVELHGSYFTAKLPATVSQNPAGWSIRASGAPHCRLSFEGEGCVFAQPGELRGATTLGAAS